MEKLKVLRYICSLLLCLLLLQMRLMSQQALITYAGFETMAFKKQDKNIFDPQSWSRYNRSGETDPKHCPGIRGAKGIAIATVIDSFSRAGKSAGKCVLDRSNGGVCHKAMFRNDLFPAGRIADRDEDERWIAFSYYLPDNGPDAWITDPAPDLLFQVHNDVVAPPQLSLNCRNDSIWVNYRFTDKDPHLTPRNKNNRLQPAWTGPLIRGKWIDWIWHFRFSPLHKNGFLEVWMNTGDGYLKIVDLHGIRIGYPCEQLTTCDIGIYKWPWKCPSTNPTVTRRVMYVDEVRIAGQHASMGSVKLPAAAPPLQFIFQKSKYRFPLVIPGKAPVIFTDSREAPVVKTALHHFRKDMEQVTQQLPALDTGNDLRSSDGRTIPIIAGTIGQSALIDRLATAGKIHIDSLRGRWETFSIELVENPIAGISRALVIAGSDSRGTAYGLFEISRRIGVHPFYWWADIPVQQQAAIYIQPGNPIIQSPSVQYRGIFLNDEDWGLQPWAGRKIDTAIKDIGPVTYEKIFELLLRLKANYIWPAMHPCTKAFWYYAQNPVVANKYGIVLGASHCEPMLRNNVFEWAHHFQTEYGAAPGEWRYDLNKQQISRYWDDRVIQSAANEAVYTVGMRGIHDGSMPGPDSMPAKIKLLEEVIRDQRALLTNRLHKPASAIPQIFCPYKEVLDLYQGGMQLPDDITIAWADDNHGYIRQLPDPSEQKRSGRSGVYYHLSYWGAPRDYLWLSSISPTLISWEMSKAFHTGADRLWVFNAGDLKPAELEIQFALDLAWNVNSWPPEKAADYAEQWAAEIFGPALAPAIGNIKSEYYRLVASGKPEHMNELNFSAAEAEQRLEAYRSLANKATRIREQVAPHLEAAYFQLIWYPVMGACAMNEKILYAQKSIALEQRGDTSAQTFAARAKAAYERIGALTQEYNTKISNGKWNGIMSANPRKQKVFAMPQTAGTGTIKGNHNNYVHTQDIELLVLDACRFTRSSDAIKTIRGLGINGNGITVLPLLQQSYNEKNITEAPYVEYTISLNAAKRRINVQCLPGFPLYKGLRLRYAIAVNKEKPQFVSIETLADTKDWGVNVLRGYAQGSSRHQLHQAGNATIRIYLPDPGLVINTITID